MTRSSAFAAIAAAAVAASGTTPPRPGTPRA